MTNETNATGTETGEMMLALAEAWEIIRNVNNGDWLNQKQEWETAVLRWRDERYKPLLAEESKRLEVSAMFQRFYDARGAFFALPDEGKMEECERAALAVYALENEPLTQMMAIEMRQFRRQVVSRVRAVEVEKVEE